jgi:hypothetical protein
MTFKNLFKNNLVYILLYKNRVKIYRLDSGKSIDKTASIPFSNSRILWADYNQGETFVKKLINDLFIDDHFSFQPVLKVLIHQIEMTEGGISQVEKRALLDSSKHFNSKETYLCFDATEVSLKKATYIIENKKGVTSVY